MWPCCRPVIPVIPGNLPIALPSPRRLGLRRRATGSATGPAAVGVVGIGTAKQNRAKRTELLVDADCCDNVEMIRDAIRALQDDGHRVRTTIFAEKTRVGMEKWCQLLREPRVRFHPVQREGTDAQAEPNDEVIVATMRKFAKLEIVESISLLTADGGFSRSLLDFQERSKKRALVMVPDYKHSVIRKYKSNGLEVVTLRSAVPPSERGSKVRALLHADGTGSVAVAERYQAFNNEIGATKVRHFLEGLGYSEGKAYLAPACAKFCWIHGIELPFPVFPCQLSTLAVQRVMNHDLDGWKRWKRYTGDLAFFLPVTRQMQLSTRELDIYGNTYSHSVFQAGGPFMLKDSPELAEEALRKLKYLDHDLNNDLSEAMFCFVNSAEKHVLRKAELLPKDGASVEVAKEHLRRVFLSHATPNQWHVAPTKPSAYLLQLLRRQNLLGTSPKMSELMTSMRRYVEEKHLPMMRTYNGLRFRILYHNNKRSSKREVIELGS